MTKRLLLGFIIALLGSLQLETFALPRTTLPPVQVLVVQGITITEQKINAVITEALKRIREELPIKIKQIGSIEVSDIAPNRNVYNWPNELYFWALRYQGVRQLRVILAPSIKGDTQDYTAGLGFVCFHKNGRLSEVFTKDSFEGGLDSFLGLANIAQHELGHQLGANHDLQEMQVMHPSSTTWGKFERLYFTQNSKAEIRKCLREFRKKKGLR